MKIVVFMTLLTMMLAEVPMSTSSKTNRLAGEKSPYLLQHAGNPIDWYPWGEEAFRKALEENRPIFLSIGYSTCHWCHVMERESFENDEVARILNESFVAIKVDREERPDIDQIYMTVCQAMTGSGGWPLTILMTPDRKPFFAGTYFPREARYGRAGLIDILRNVVRLWKERQGDIVSSADQITASLKAMNRRQAGDIPGREALDLAFRSLQKNFDAEHGGFGSAPKFPVPHQLVFLLRYGQAQGQPPATNMSVRTLQALRRGGIYDQAGFGFHRYSTDREFLVPHFEKMLYDQALLAMAYLEAYQSTAGQEFADTAREIFTYVLRDMTGPEGGFYSAEDADSEGEEGRFYVWTSEEIERILGPEKSRETMNLFSVRPDGNYRDEASGSATGRNILHLDPKAASVTLDETVRKTLLEYRKNRIPPLKDDKVIASWNGLMIAALARGYRVLGDRSLLKAADRAAGFVLTRMTDAGGHLLRRYRAGSAALPAYLDDYAFMAWGLIELYEASLDSGYLASAIRLTDDMIRDYSDEREGGFLFSGKRNEELLAPTKEAYDGALPSGNSAALMNLVRLSRMTGREDYAREAGVLLKTFSREVLDAPHAHTMFLMALSFYLGPTREIVIAGQPGAPDTQALVDAVNRVYDPHRVMLLHPPGEPGRNIEALVPFIEGQVMIDGKAAAYVCRSFACDRPVTDPAELAGLLR